MKKMGYIKNTVNRIQFFIQFFNVFSIHIPKNTNNKTQQQDERFYC